MTTLTSTNPPTIIALEGNIGAGKTTLLRYVREHYPKIVLIDEPVDIWETMKTPDGRNILQHFYGDMERWAYTFQNTALLTRIENIQRAIDSNPPDSVFLMERSYLTDRHVFAKILHEDGKINAMEMDIYMRWYNHFTTKFPIKQILWLNTDVDTCVERIHNRNRPGEESISRNYLERLDKAHRHWLEDSSHTDNVIKISNTSITSDISYDDICKTYLQQYHTSVSI